MSILKAYFFAINTRTMLQYNIYKDISLPKTMIGQVLKEGIERGASDVILSPDNYPSLKIDGDIVYIGEMGLINRSELDQEILSIIPEKMKKKFSDELELDFWVTLKWYGRFRANVLSQRKGYSIVFRVIQERIPDFRELDLPESILNFTQKRSGLILVTGGVGSGKSTTLAALLNEINQEQEKHIITIEDPIEFLHESKNSLVEQREVWVNTLSFENGLKYALRQASDVIMVGEMRDLETFRLALRAAETGNLVLATLHTSGASRTISRIIDMFPWDEKDQIRSQLSESLIAVIWQDLVKKNQSGRVPATEILVNTTNVANMIRDNNVHQIDSAIETGKEYGMLPMKKSLENLFGKWLITEEQFESYKQRNKKRED